MDYETLKAMAEEDCKINQLNIMDKQIDLCSKKQFMICQKYEIVREIRNKKRHIEDIVKKAHDKANASSPIEITNQKLIEKQLGPILKPIQKEIEDLEDLYAFVEDMAKDYAFRGQDIGRIIELIKMENS